MTERKLALQQKQKRKKANLALCSTGPFKDKKNLSVSKPTYWPVPCSSISDHEAVYAAVNVRVSRCLPQCKFICNMKNFDEAAYQHDFLSLPLSLVCGLESIDDKPPVLNSLITKCIDHNASLRRVKVILSRHPWCIMRK